METPACPPISVVVCTRDRADDLAACLAALEQLDYPCYELIVVDNAPHSETTAVLVARHAQVRYVREERPGLNRARNRGVTAAHYDLIAYTDDDVQVDAAWLRGFAAAFADTSVAVVTGLVLPVDLTTEAQRLFEQYGGMGKGLAPRTFQRAAMTDRELIAAHQCGVGANMAFRRSTLATLGGFDSALDNGTPARGGGDLDIFHRALVAGLQVRYDPRAMVRHRHRRTMAALRQQLYDNGRSFGVYLLTNWVRRSVPRRATLRFALGWVSGWLLARVVARLTGRLDFPLRLICAELWGALSAPVAYVRTQRYARHVDLLSL